MSGFVWRSAAIVIWLFLLGCNNTGNRDAGAECLTAQDCEGGEVCEADQCMRVCATDNNCAPGEVCQGSLCVPGGGDQKPVITNLNGDSASANDCRDTPGNRCVATGLVISGEHLDRARFTLLAEDASEAVELEIREGGSDNSVEVELPSTITPGKYTLTAANTAGTTSGELELLRGEPGETLTPDEMILAINQANETLSRGVLPVGSNNQSVAAGEHQHPIYLTSMPAHTHPGSELTSLPSHTHSGSDLTGALPSHTHDSSDITGGVPAHEHAFSELTGSVDTADLPDGGYDDEYLRQDGGTVTGDLDVTGGDMTVSGNVSLGSGTSSQVWVAGTLQTGTAPPTTYDVDLNRYYRIVDYVEPKRSLPVDHTIVTRLCGDEDGCGVTLGMRGFTGAPDPSVIASNGPYRFFYDPTSRWWRVSNTDAWGQDNDNVTAHVIHSRACYFTDGAYDNDINQGDTAVGFAVATWNDGGYNNANMTCELLIVD